MLEDGIILHEEKQNQPEEKVIEYFIVKDTKRIILLDLQAHSGDGKDQFY